MNGHPGKFATALLAVALTTSVAQLPAASAAPADEPAVQLSAGDGGDRFLRGPANGRTAIDRLGDDLDRVAEMNDLTASELRRRLLADDSLWVHPTGLLYFVDAAPDDIRSEAPAAAPFPYEKTFELNSKPGSSRTIYLDFNGENVSGTAWNDPGFYGVPAGSHPAFDLDDSPETFNAAERDVVQSVWQRVSEDFSPFDVNVTTQDPGVDALRRDNDWDFIFGTRVLITPSTAAATAICNDDCGGSAFMGVFTRVGTYAQPAWVFPDNLGDDAKAIADAASHEVGHNLNLDHDGTATAPYFEGHGAWAPIMGTSYGKPIAQWSQGEYAGAMLTGSVILQNNPDDLAVMTYNGLPVRPDDHSNTTSSATSLLSTGSAVEGIVTSRTDKDYFALPQGCAGTVSLSAVPAPTSPNLDIQLRVVKADGTLVASNNPGSAFSTQDVATGMGAAVTTVASADTPLFAEIDGVGAGDPATNGYSDYASIGRYTLTSTECSGGGSDPAFVSFEQSTQTVGEGADEAVLTVVRTGDTSVPASVSYARTGGTATPGSDFTLATGTLNFAADQLQKSIRVVINDDAVDEADETVEVTLSNPSTGTTIGGFSASTLTITDDDEPAPARPDLLISTRQARGYIGDDVYNKTGAKQTKQRSALRKQTRSFFIEITNDGAATDRFTVKGTKAKGAKITYSNGGNDLTAELLSGDAWIELAPDQFGLIRVDVKPGKKAKVGSLKSVLVTAVSSGGLTDVVKATVKVVKKRR